MVFSSRLDLFILEIGAVSTAEKKEKLDAETLKLTELTIKRVENQFIPSCNILNT